ncbi:gamma-butyrobetaine hydroxylase-like domain-containing protein [Billgrantia sp. LNSP4103-1]|uniref:gamma-butyrobetaine hydroxylase-like domain-containing protein n=1 Tax=Billgrantia sp. LNSP4103-1 TaxID=3410266 RepID=UPI00403F9279
MTAPTPSKIHYHKNARELELSYADGESYRLPVEYLRVYSPSAEVRGHHPSQAVLQVGKKDVGLKDIEPVGRYAVKLAFDDGHDSGLYSWEYLHELAINQEAYWADYLERLEKAGASREPLGIEIKQL